MTNALLLIFPKDHRKRLFQGFSRLKYMFDRRFPVNRETKTTSKTNDKIRAYRTDRVYPVIIHPRKNAVYERCKCAQNIRMWKIAELILGL